MKERRVALAIIGAGPAGLAAAIEAAGRGVETVVLDAHPEPGGHYYSLPSSEFRLPAADRDTAEGRSLAEGARRAGAALWSGAQAWGLYAEKQFLVCLSSGPEARLRADRVIVAAGAQERPLHCPGWTLPGVMTAGAALRMLKNQMVLPGHRFLLAGSGPLQLALAAHLVCAHVELAAVLEARSLRSLLSAWRSSTALLGQRQRATLGAGYITDIVAARVPLRTGWTVARVVGRDQVEAAVICPVDRQGHPGRDGQETLPVDTVCLGHGLLPASHLWRQIDVDLVFDPVQQYHQPVRDRWGETSQPGLYVAGDAAAVCGRRAAELEGRLAGLAAAAQFGLLSESRLLEQARPLQQDVERERRFARLLADLFGPLPGLLDLATDDTVICRCENVTLGQVKQAVADGARSVQEVKHQTRAGMGWCQGRTCAGTVARTIAAATGLDLAEASRYTIRPPAFPVPLAELLEEDIHA